MPFSLLCCEAKLFGQKRFRSRHPGWNFHMGKFSTLLPRSQPGFSHDQHIKISTMEKMARRDLGNRASPADWALMKRLQGPMSSFMFIVQISFVWHLIIHNSSKQKHSWEGRGRGRGRGRGTGREERDSSIFNNYSMSPRWI